MSLVVRPAVAADAAGIARVHIAAWRETYTRLLPPGALDDLDPVARTQRWTEIIGDDRTEKWVAILDAAIVGWASAGAGQALLDAATGDRPAYLWWRPTTLERTRSTGATTSSTTARAPSIYSPVIR